MSMHDMGEGVNSKKWDEIITGMQEEILD